MTRPVTLVAVVGTGTDVGKTWASCRLAEQWRSAGLTVAARKPVQSFEPGAADRGDTDAHHLARATGEQAHAVCPPHRWYERAYAPPMASEALGLGAFTIGDLVDEIIWPAERIDIGIVEAAGGVRSPMAIDGDGVTLVHRLLPDHVVLVAHAGLGTIDAVRLSVGALGLRRPTVLLNRFDPADDLHRRNAEWLAERDGFAIVTSVDALQALARPRESWLGSRERLG